MCTDTGLHSHEVPCFRAKQRFTKANCTLSLLKIECIIELASLPRFQLVTFLSPLPMANRVTEVRPEKSHALIVQTELCLSHFRGNPCMEIQFWYISHIVNLPAFNSWCVHYGI